MQNKKALISFISIGFILAIGWVFFIISQSILKENINHNLKHVPENATFAMQLNGKEIAEHTLFSVFLESKDQEVIKLLQESFIKNIKTEGKFKNYGIDFLSNIVVFEIPYKNETVLGILVNVTNESLFRKNLKSTGKVFALKHNVGLILSVGPKSNPILKPNLQALANTILSNVHKSSAIKFSDLQDSGKFIEIFSNGSILKSRSNFKKSNILFELDRNSLILSGKTEINTSNSKKINTIRNGLYPNGLHISTSLIPVELSDTMNKWLDQFGVKIPVIEEISMNFMGTKVINHSSGFFVVPQMDLFIECEKEISIQKLLSTPEFQAYFDYSMDENSINFQDEKLFFKQITPNSFYIGIIKNPIFGTSKSNDLFRMEGSLKPLTNVQGGGLMTAFLQMLPIYKACNNIAAHTENFSLKLTKANDKEARIKGNLRFYKEYSPMNELVKFLLQGQLVK